MRFLALILLTFLLLDSTKTTPISQQNHNGNERNSRIIGGLLANIRAYPYTVAINVTTSDSRFFCGGALYGTDFVITAGQCVNEATIFTVSLGSASLQDEDLNRITVATSTYYLHPDYNPLTLENDIGIIEFRLPITHTDYIKSIDLLPEENVPLDTQLYVLGWGQTSDQNSSLSNKLQVAHLGAITNEECKLTYGSQLADTMVCIVGNYNEGICHGDTGSPAVITLRTSHSVHVGVASFVSSNGCKSPDPSGFTRTFSNLDWIKNVTGAN